jgi:hypothetical protein
MIEFIQKFCLHLVAIFLDLLLGLLFLDWLLFFIRRGSNDLLFLGLDWFDDFFVRLNLLLLLLFNNWLIFRFLNFLGLLWFSWFSFDFLNLWKGSAVFKVVVLIGNVVLEPALWGFWSWLSVLVELSRLTLTQDYSLYLDQEFLLGGSWAESPSSWVGFSVHDDSLGLGNNTVVA